MRRLILECGLAYVKFLGTQMEPKGSEQPPWGQPFELI
jgi:hypothetical protein